MALVSILMSMMAAFAVSMTAWLSGTVSLFEAFGLYIGVGFGVMIASFALFFLASAWRARPQTVMQHGASAGMPALATIPVRSSSS
jgi:hypothetical protein